MTIRIGAQTGVPVGAANSRAVDDSFDTFVAGRSRALLRTAYLLTRDHILAEDLALYVPV